MKHSGGPHFVLQLLQHQAEFSLRRGHFICTRSASFSLQRQSRSVAADMGVTSRPLLLVCACFAAALVGGARAEGMCLQDGKHKAAPGPEPHLRDCALYADNSCCTDEDIQDISHVPSASNKNEPWDKCGPLSSECEGFLKRVSCFYRCSPDAARWPHPHRRSYIQAVPLCHSFCRDWFDACRMDLTCARNWARDPRGQNCTGSCVQYQQMYQHGRDLCESLWGDAFMTVEDDPEDGGEAGDGGRPCGCLTLSPSDKDVIAALRAQRDDPEELDTTKTGLPQYRAPCQTKLPLQARSGKKGNSVMRKRSVMVDDMEGSGSGL
uniref:Retbindin n=3 Tax=Scophthalmus maximus TaxID=52904 RepID=A0A8D2ZNL2_SCOMX